MSSREKAEPGSAGQGKGMAPEFSRRIPLARTGRPLEERVVASAEEREGLRQRFGLLSLSKLECVFQLERAQDNIVLAEGHLQAVLEQACIITGEAVPEVIDERFSLRFIPEADMPEDEEIDIEALLQEDADDVPHDGKVIDLGEAAAEQLALALAPYPRKEGAGLEQFVDVTPSDDELDANAQSGKANPFEALKKLQEKQ